MRALIQPLNAELHGSVRKRLAMATALLVRYSMLILGKGREANRRVRSLEDRTLLLLVLSTGSFP